jgi:hypothetical protein
MLEKRKPFGFLSLISWERLYKRGEGTVSFSLLLFRNLIYMMETVEVL